MRNVRDYLIEEELELYKSMLDAQPQSTFLIDKDKNIIGIFNASPETLAGYTVDDIVGNSILKFANDIESPFHQVCSMFNNAFDSVSKTGIPLKFQFMFLDNYLEATITKISGDRVLSQVLDVTNIVLKFKDIEHKKHNELSVAFLAGGLSSWSYNVKTKIISSSYENNVICGDITLDALLDLIEVDYRSSVVQMFDDIISHRKEHSNVVVLVKDINGEKQWSDVHAVAHEYSEDGEVTLIIGSQKNTTKEYEYNKKLKQLNRQNALILNNTNSGFAYLTHDLVVEWENMSVVFAENHICNLFKKGQLLEPIDNNCGNHCIKAITQSIDTKQQVISKIKMKSGMTIELVAKPVFSDTSELEGVVVRLDNITEKELAVYELAKAKDKAEQSDNLKSAFLANMSHEIRTPLNSIVGFTQLLPEVESKEEQLSYINIINSNSQILLNLINDILDLSKIEAGYFSCNDVLFDLSKLFYDLEITFEMKVRDGVKLICDTPKSNYFVKLDNIRVSQVISNFITNAIKFTHQGYIKMGFMPMGNYVKLYVEDTGSGMSQEHADNVFERFEKFDSFEQGTGLGTSIAKAIVDAYEGEIGVESTLGVGSTFWAILPIGINETENIKLLKEDKSDILIKDIEFIKEPSVFNILITEDNDSNYKLIEILLRGYKLRRAINGVEALKMINESSYDLILMDIRMPLMDGIEAIRRIREVDTKTVIVALTANAFDDDMQRAFDVGANEFLTKPINKKQLFEVITKYSVIKE